MQGETQRGQLLDKISRVNAAGFDALALEVFRYQAATNPVYKQYLELLRVDAEQVSEPTHIPFLPIQLFKHHTLQTGQWPPVRVFASSGTTGSQNSRHLLRSEDWYRNNARRGFAHCYGRVDDYCFLALLPSYLERSDSSLVFMVDDFIRHSKYAESGFFLHDLAALSERLRYCQDQGIPTVLIGVSFALWDLAERYPGDYQDVIIMETGGMKGRRRELTRAELHTILTEAFRVPAIHSEYGMTELLSQAYSKGQGLFRPSPTLRVLSREINDPLQWQQPGRHGALNLIDLANLDTISFIATDDLGIVYEDHSFEVLGRLDAGDLRGCNLMML